MRLFEFDVYKFTQTQQNLKKLLNNPKFKAWFSGSKVVDDKGNPLICFHYTKKDYGDKFPPLTHFGTDKAALDRFLDSGGGDFDDQDDPTGEKRKNEKMNNTKTFPVFLNIKNPLEFFDDGFNDKNIDIALFLIRKHNFNPKELGFKKVKNEYQSLYDGDNEKHGELLIKAMEKQNKDGFWYINHTEDPGSVSWINLYNSQAKPVFEAYK